MRLATSITAPVLVLLMFTATPALAARETPLIDHDNIAVTGSKSAADVKKAIVNAAARRGWKPIKDSASSVRFEYNARGKHLVVIDVPYNAKGYGVKYVSSQNLNYLEKDGTRYIHPKYNKWIDDLIKGIDLEMATHS